MVKNSVITCASLSSVDSNLLVSGCADGSVQLWDVDSADYSPLQSYTTCPAPMPANEILSSAWSCTDLLFAVGSRSGSIFCGDTAGGALRPFLGHQAVINALDFHPYGNVFASASLDTKLKLWDVRAKDACIQTLSEHKCNVTSVVHSPDGQWLVSGDEEGTVKFWDLSMGRCFKEVSVLGKTDSLVRGKSRVTKFVFHPLELILTCVVENNQLAFWDVETFQLLAASGKLPPSASIEQVQYHPYGKRLFSFGSGNIAKWTWDPTVKGSLSNGGWTVGAVLDAKMNTKEDVGSGHIVVGMGNTTSVWKLHNDQEHVVVAPYAQDQQESKLTSPTKKTYTSTTNTSTNNTSNAYQSSMYTSDLVASSSINEDPLDMYSKLQDYNTSQTPYTGNNNNTPVASITATPAPAITTTTASTTTSLSTKSSLSATTNQNILAAVMNAFSLDDVKDVPPPVSPLPVPITNNNNNNNNNSSNNPDNGHGNTPNPEPFQPRIISLPLTGYRDEPERHLIPSYNFPTTTAGLFSTVFTNESCHPIIRRPRADGGEVQINSIMAESPSDGIYPSYGNSSSNNTNNTHVAISTTKTIPSTTSTTTATTTAATTANTSSSFQARPVSTHTYPTNNMPLPEVPVKPVYNNATPVVASHNSPAKPNLAISNNKNQWEGTLIPASAVASGVSGNLDPSAFLPQSKYAGEPLDMQYDDNAQTVKKSVNVEQVRTEVLRDHPTIVSVLGQRIQLLQTLQEFWRRGELPAMLDCLAQMRDPPLVYDVLHSLQGVFLHGERSYSFGDPESSSGTKVTLSLQDAAEMLRVLAMLIQARFEHYAALGVQYTLFIANAFAQVVKDTLGNKNTAKTMASEEREGKVKKLVKLLKNMQTILTTAAKKHTSLQKDITHVYSLIDSLVELL